MRPDVRHDLLTVRLGELDAARTVLSAAADRLGSGWVQDRWQDQEGVCLVRALRMEGAAPAAARAVDLAWHALHDDAAGARWQAPPQVRLARVRDLTRWNDRPGRRVGEVVALLSAADRVAAGEVARLRTELGLVARVPTR